MSKESLKRDEIGKLLDHMKIEVGFYGHHERGAFDRVSADLLFIIYEHVKVKGLDRCQMSTTDLAHFSGATRTMIDIRLRHLARYGLIRCETPWRNDGSGLRDSLITYLNPLIMEYLSADRVSKRKELPVTDLVKMGIARLGKGNLQGFKIDCEYGCHEPI